MKERNRSYSGFIMIVTLLIIALATIMTSIMYDRGGSYVPYMKALVDRQHAMMYALSGIAFVQEQLSRAVEVEQKEEAPQPQAQARQGTPQQSQTKKPTDIQKMQHTLKTVLPILNQWQHIELKEEYDGVDGIIAIYLSCEDGKINLNNIFDFEKKQFVGEKKQQGSEQGSQAQAQKPPVPSSNQKDWKQLLTPVFEQLEKEAKAPDLFKALEELLKKREYPLNDVTELLHSKNFTLFKRALYPEPSSVASKGSKEIQRTYTLTDLFTLYSDEPTIEPWLLSDSMIGVLGLQRVATGQDAKKQGEALQEIIKKAKVKTNWTQQEWNVVLKPLYGEIKMKSPQQFGLFAQTFRARYFSAIISATIGEVTQRLFVILERIENSQDTKTIYDVKIRKFSWI